MTISPLSDLQATLKALRAKETGCSWNKEQTLKSLRAYLIEEVYEVCSAIEQEDLNELKKELGDLLFQILFLSEIASEMKAFNLEDVMSELNTKLIRRHPHVFEHQENKSAKQITQEWEARKKHEQKTSPGSLQSIAPSTPELLKCYSLKRQMMKLGFSWPTLDQAIRKVKEELDEVIEAESLEDSTLEELELEIGDLLSAVCSLSIQLGVQPELALMRSNEKYMNRSNYMLDQAKYLKKTAQELSLEEWMELWNLAKENESSTKT